MSWKTMPPSWPCKLARLAYLAAHIGALPSSSSIGCSVGIGCMRITSLLFRKVLFPWHLYHEGI